MDLKRIVDHIDKIATHLEEKKLLREATELDIISNTIEKIAKKEKKWIQKAVSEKDEGKFGKWCKSNGFDGVCQACIDKAVAEGGKPQQMALFAVNVSDGKYTYPNKKKDDK
ncbi:MAG: hypothetical protein GF334_02055 [Candidatus Altiarchaeales archaeon]|nr:hypothetical protein [Candidatus Altiarchaeales archaeon]